MAERFSLSGKNVILTGGTGILGSVFAEAFAEAGAQLAIIDQDRAKLDEIAIKLSATYKNKVVGYACDIADEGSVKKTIDQIVAEFESIHVLHNNAASKGKNLDNFFATYEEFSLETWKDIMSVNVDAIFLLTKYVGKHMQEKGIAGSMIQTASVYGVVAPDQRIYEGSRYMDRQISSPAVYSASKAAVIGLSNYLSAYWGHAGIRVNSITPGGIESGQNETFKSKYSARVPLGRMGKADELVGAVLFLASDASTYITGQNIIVDGGLTVW